jgi:hypothetical protein
LAGVRHSEELKAKALALARLGLSRTQIGQQLGLSRNKVSGLLWRIAHPRDDAPKPSKVLRRPTLPDSFERPRPHIYKPQKSKPVVMPALRPNFATLVPMRTRSPNGATCCWHGCTAKPAEIGKPYCDVHRRA